jgi:hypothetical protein
VGVPLQEEEEDVYVVAGIGMRVTIGSGASVTIGYGVAVGIIGSAPASLEVPVTPVFPRMRRVRSPEAVAGERSDGPAGCAVCCALAILDRRYVLSFTANTPNVMRNITVETDTMMSVLWLIICDTIFVFDFAIR